MIALDWTKAAKLAAVVALAVAVWYHGYNKGNDAGEVAVATLRAQHAETLADLADRARQAAEVTRAAERAVGLQLHQIDAQHQEALRHASTSARDAVLADVRAGRVGVRARSPHCPMPAPDATAAAPAIHHGAADRGSGDALTLAVADTIGIAARADERLAACQAVVSAYASASAKGAEQPQGGAQAEVVR